MEILVVDNGSRDGSAQLDSEFPEVRFIRLQRNFGLTKALNIGVRAAAGEFCFFLHDDTEPDPGAVALLAGALVREPDAAAVCPLLVREDGTPAPQIAALPAPGASAPAWTAAEPCGEPHPVEYPTGAALMVRTYFIRAMRQIDERYGQYGSDIEICYQIAHAGKRILLIPEARVLHYGTGECATEIQAADRALAAARYLGKHFGFFHGLKARIASVLIAVAGLRLARAGYLISGQKIDGSQPGA